jgi:hypothetical protein
VEVMATEIKTFHVIEKDGKFWGVQYADGHSTEYGYGSIHNAHPVDPRFCRKPEDATYRGSYLIPKLRQGRIVKVRMTTTVEIIEGA